MKNYKDLSLNEKSKAREASYLNFNVNRYI